MKRDSEVKGKRPSTLWRASLCRLPCARAVCLAMAAAEQSLTMRVGARRVTSVDRRLLIPARTLTACESYRSSQVWLAETVCLLGTFRGAWVRSQQQTRCTSTPVPAPDSCVRTTLIFSSISVSSDASSDQVQSYR